MECLIPITNINLIYLNEIKNQGILLVNLQRTKNCNYEQGDFKKEHRAGDYAALQL